jgi:hypothetical protein
MTLLHSFRIFNKQVVSGVNFRDRNSALPPRFFLSFLSCLSFLLGDC